MTVPVDLRLMNERRSSEIAAATYESDRGREQDQDRDKAALTESDGGIR